MNLCERVSGKKKVGFAIASLAHSLTHTHALVKHTHTHTHISHGRLFDFYMRATASIHTHIQIHTNHRNVVCMRQGDGAKLYSTSTARDKVKKKNLYLYGIEMVCVRLKKKEYEV